MNNRKNRNTSGILSLRCFYLENTIVRKSIPLRIGIDTLIVPFVKARIQLSDMFDKGYLFADTSAIILNCNCEGTREKQMENRT